TKAITEIPEGSYEIGETFTFTLAADADNDTTGYAMTTDVVKTAQKDGSVSFGQITFSKAGDYYFTITESTGNTPGMSYASVKYAKVKVTSDANGKLSVDTTYGDSKDKTTSSAPFTITNIYTRPTTQVELKVTKNLTQEPANSYDANEDFTFTLGEDSSNNKNGYAMPDNLTKTTKESGTATFDAITFKLPGTYYFTIKETKGSTPGMRYDDTAKYAKVVVVKNNDGTLSKTTTYGADKDNAGNGSLSVTNVYTQPKTTLEIPVKKVLDVKPAGSYSGSDTFTFTITNGYAITNTANGGMTLPTNLTTSTTAGGTAKFDAITFTKPGEYMVIINESQGSNPDITYDTSDKKVKIKVEQADTGALSASVVGVYDKDDKGQGTELKITNKYVSPTSPLQLSASKTVTQSPANSYKDDEDFTFTLAEDDPNATGYSMPGTTSKTVKNGGTVTFDAITFSAEGTFYFTITESNGNTHGMTYDTDAKYVKVDVTKDNDGVLVPVATYSDKKDGTYGNSLTITNSYTKPETSVTLNVK
ncbi:MAG: hypothetical protein HUJ56_03580, partial [Erysipelotrichaceae bacterium]|nr:hypothetical protein [Erysipelotrichaceae bacterium]